MSKAGIECQKGCLGEKDDLSNQSCLLERMKQVPVQHRHANAGSSMKEEHDHRKFWTGVFTAEPIAMNVVSTCYSLSDLFQHYRLQKCAFLRFIRFVLVF